MALIAAGYATYHPIPNEFEGGVLSILLISYTVGYVNHVRAKGRSALWLLLLLIPFLPALALALTKPGPQGSTEP